MTYFVGVQPPESLCEEVLSFRKQWKHTGIAPHITAKAPCGLTPDEVWVERIQRICQGQTEIGVCVSGVSLFGSSVLFLRVESVELIRLHNLIVADLGISVAEQTACFEGAQYLPHLTLLQTRFASSQVIPTAAVTAAAEQFSESRVFQVNSLVVFRKEPGKKYETLANIKFGEHLTTNQLR